MAKIDSILIGRDASPLERRIAEILARRSSERLGVEVVVRVEEDDLTLAHAVIGTPATSHLVRDAGIDLPHHDEAFAIQPGSPAIVCARNARALVFGAGALLRHSSFSQGRWVTPSTSIVAAPDKDLRPIYFATHFGNWYCHASEEDLRTYLEDLALDGYNAVVTWFDFHHYKSLADGAAQWDRLTRLDRLAREIGLKTGRIAIANESFEGQAPSEWRATGRLEGTGYETDLCPSIPEARELILRDRLEFLQKVRATTELDWLCLWPYDQGGCNCDRCRPWPTTYMELCREIAMQSRDILPDTDVQVSAWWIGTHVAGEDEPFFEYLDRGEDWFDTIVAGTVELRRWLASGRKVPQQYGVLLFPEISMFDALPWGGRGANPAPRKFAAEMAELGPSIAGAMPYSEGRYEDVNKVLWSQFQWDSSQDVTQILEDYCRAFFGPNAASEGAQLLLDIEAGLKDLPAAARIRAKAQELESRMEPWGVASWRWKMVRAHVDIDALKAELESPETPMPRKLAVRSELEPIYERLQRELSLHDERSLINWIYLPFDTWVELPFNELVLPTGV